MTPAVLTRAGAVALAIAAVSLSLAGVAAAATSGEPASASGYASQESDGVELEPVVAAAGEPEQAVAPVAATPQPVAGPTPAAVSTAAAAPEDARIAADTLAPAGPTLALEDEDPADLGTLTISPATGSATTAITVTTSAGCNSTSNNVAVVLATPLLEEDGVTPQAVAVADPTDAGFSTTSPITVPLDLTLAEAATELGAPLPAGTYTLILACIDYADADDEEGTVTGVFGSLLYLTSPTAYQLTSPTPTPTRSPSPTPTGATLVTPTPTPARTATPTATPAIVPVSSSTGTGGGTSSGGLAYTGAPVVELVLSGLALTGLGLAFLLAARLRAVRYPMEEPS